jgi:hypothetical protein
MAKDCLRGRSIASGILTEIGEPAMRPNRILTTAARKCLRPALGVILSIAVGPLLAQDLAELTQIVYDGTLGPAHIGLTLLVKSNNTVAGGHYFYAKYLTDIPLTGALQPSTLVLQGNDGGGFALKFIGNGREGAQALNFDNSVGLEGTWSMDGKTLPVKLSMRGRSTVSASGRWYEMVTDDTDAEFEARVQGFYKAALAGDRAAAARYISFPLRVNHNGTSRIVLSASELAAQWDTIFTPAYLAALKNDLPHDLSIVRGQAMLGAGDAFFSSKGATALNLP